MPNHISTPCRIRLFGEHQDYLGLPVIPAAISLRIHINGKPSLDPMVTLRLPDMGSTASFDIDTTFPYTAGSV